MKTIKTFLVALAMVAVLATASIAMADSDVMAASFSADVNTGAAPLTVHFYDGSNGGPTIWHWDFGDGSSSTLQNPVYTYHTPGTYTVTLTVSNGAQSDTVKSDVVVTNPLVTTPTPAPGQVIVQPILVPVHHPHHDAPRHDAPRHDDKHPQH